MKGFILLILITLSVSKLEAQIQDAQVGLTVLQNKKIEYDSDKLKRKSYRIVDGDKVVFEYVLEEGEKGNGSKAKEILAFQVPQDENRFVYKNEDLLKADAVYVQKCRCQDRGVHQVYMGQIKGKLNKKGIWKVDLDLEIPGNRTGKIYTFNFEDTIEP